MIKVSDNVYVGRYGNLSDGAVITFGKDASKIIDQSDSKSKRLSKYFMRGANDQRLLEMHKLATESPNKWQLIETKASFVAGAGFRLFKPEVDENNQERLVPQFSSEFNEWSDKIGLSDYWEEGCMQQEFAKELNVLLLLNTNKEVDSLRVIDNNDIRAERPKEGKRITHFWVSEEFNRGKQPNKRDCKVYPAFDPKNPTKYPASIIHIIAKKPGQKVYGLANWYGTKGWANIANSVPKYYEAAFKNGFFVTHHIQLPDDYFDKEGVNEDEKEELRETTLNAIQETLQSVDEANKVIYTFYKAAADGRSALKEVKINAVENPLKDEAFIKMFEAANKVQASGHGVPAKLAGVQLGNNMGSSGKEIAAEAAYLQDFLTVFDRERLCKPVRIAMRIDKVFQEYHLGIQRINSYVPNSTSKQDASHPENAE